MSAIDLHNSLFSPEPVLSPTTDSDGSGPHARHQSVISTATLHTTTSRHSHPTEPLLHATSFESYAYQDLLARQPLHPDGPRTGWDLGLNFEGDPVTPREKKGYWEKLTRKRLRRLRTARGVLELLIAVWALYTTIRYFVAYVIYPAVDRQIVALCLGMSSLLSFTSLLLFMMRSMISTQLLNDQDLQNPWGLKTLARLVTPYIVSFFLIAPAIVNFTLVFVWRRSSVTALGLEGRCHWDLDVVWRAVGGQCTSNAPAWSAWLAAAIVRLVVTSIVLVIFHVTCYSYEVTRWSALPRLGHLRLGSTQKAEMHAPPRTPSSHTLAASIQNNQRSSAPSVHSFALHRVSQSSQSTPNLPSSRPGSSVESVPALRHPRSFLSARTAVIPDFRDAQSSGGHSGPSLGRSSGRTYTGNTVETTTSSEDASSENTPRSLRRVRSLFDMQGGSGSQGHSQHSDASETADTGEGKKMRGIPDEDIQGFADRFRSLITQFHQAGLEITFTESPEQSPVTPPIYNAMDQHTSYASRDEFGQLVPPEDPVLMFSHDPRPRAIQRMPTIESVGSREVISVGRSSRKNTSTTTRTSSLVSSRPPTRSDPSQPSSRANSLTARSTELGELAAPSTPSTSTGSRPSTRGSASTTFFTAAGGLSSTSTRDTPRSRANSELAPVTEHGELAVADGSVASRSVGSTEYFTPASLSTKAGTFGEGSGTGTFGERGSGPRARWGLALVTEMGQLVGGRGGRSPVMGYSGTSAAPSADSGGSFGRVSSRASDEC